ncbi:MAG: bifunctional demethylmenaquinone methyltransferase/2-methoxy-6-polyprenyl-1,4-benzoquinol methylase UbiE [Pseudomonadota bacterium]|nr:bifunctional demethylmenaquinone methyltransferase/2-methoxy-6-polyprenyl-1,4-benzoquinol methylase UbiE [Pseudomonadota bacterium]
MRKLADSKLADGKFAHSEQQIATMFDNIAPRYDLLNRLLSLRQDIRWRKCLVQHVPLHARLLDVATGTGDVISACYRHRRQVAHCVGIDISNAMLNLARGKLPATTVLQHMSATNLRFPDASFNAITIAFGIRNVNDTSKALAEFQRVLTADGRLLILEFFPIVKKGLFTRLFAFYLHKVLPRLASLVSDRSAYSYLPASISEFYHAELLQQKASEHGFEVCKVQKFMAGAVQLLVLQKHA